MPDNDYRKPYMPKNDLTPKKDEEGTFGEDMGSSWENIKKGLGMNADKEAEYLALNKKLKKAGAWGY